MVRPISLRPEGAEATPRNINPAVYVARAGAAYLRAFTCGDTPANVARTMFGTGDFGTAEVLRAASGQAQTQQTGWAKELATQAVSAVIQDAASISAGANIIARGLSLDLGRLYQLSVPSRPLTPADAAQFIAEAGAIPVRAWNFTAGNLHPYALKTITTYSYELSESSNIEAAVRQTLAESFGLGIDARMLSSSAGSASAPAGLFQSPPLTGTAGGGLVAMLGDVKQLFNALATNGAGANVVLVAPLAEAASLKAQVGPKFDWPIYASTAMPAATLGAIDATSFVSAFTSAITFDVARAAALQMDTAPVDPLPIATGPSIKSAYQVDMLALRATMFISWLMRVSGHAQICTGVTW
jgi:hypothetical protein